MVLSVWPLLLQNKQILCAVLTVEDHRGHANMTGSHSTENVFCHQLLSVFRCSQKLVEVPRFYLTQFISIGLAVKLFVMVCEAKPFYWAKYYSERVFRAVNTGYTVLALELVTLWMLIKCNRHSSARLYWEISPHFSPLPLSFLSHFFSTCFVSMFCLTPIRALRKKLEKTCTE